MVWSNLTTQQQESLRVMPVDEALIDEDGKLSLADEKKVYS